MKAYGSKKIFTYFKEETMPPYTKLCLKTWKHNLPPGYEIIILDDKNLFKYIPENILPDSLRMKCSSEIQCSFPHFFDFAAACVLYFNGGIFLDTDTIMTDKFKPEEILLENTGLIMFSEGKSNVCPGFMMANKGSLALEELIRRYQFTYYLPKNKKSERNYLINDVLAEFSSKDVMLLECEDYGYFMEKTMYGIFNEYIYKKYYFSDACKTEDFFENSKGLTALHNSITPQKYKKMKENEFLEQNILLAKIFKHILTLQTA